MSSMVCVANILNASLKANRKSDAQLSYPKPEAPPTDSIPKKTTRNPQQGSPSKSSEK
jgi:hypothetical protein